MQAFPSRTWAGNRVTRDQLHTQAIHRTVFRPHRFTRYPNGELVVCRYNVINDPFITSYHKRDPVLEASMQRIRGPERMPILP